MFDQPLHDSDALEPAEAHPRWRCAVAAAFDTVTAAVAALARGDIVVVVDDADRENEGDLILAAETASAERIGFVLRNTSGLLCVALSGERCDTLDLPPMVARGDEAQGTAFTVSVDARRGTTTGISADDRATTVRALGDPSSRAADFRRPGVFRLGFFDFAMAATPAAKGTA